MLCAYYSTHCVQQRSVHFAPPANTSLLCLCLCLQRQRQLDREQQMEDVERADSSWQELMAGAGAAALFHAPLSLPTRAATASNSHDQSLSKPQSKSQSQPETPAAPVIRTSGESVAASAPQPPEPSQLQQFDSFDAFFSSLKFDAISARVRYVYSCY